MEKQTRKAAAKKRILPPLYLLSAIVAMMPLRFMLPSRLHSCACSVAGPDHEPGPHSRYFTLPVVFAWFSGHTPHPLPPGVRRRFRHIIDGMTHYLTTSLPPT